VSLIGWELQSGRKGTFRSDLDQPLIQVRYRIQEDKRIRYNIALAH
jgi:hypothetical protein